MRVYLTFDVEIWCDGWANLDQQFPSAFDRYCYGRSAAGDYALPKTLEIMNAHGLQGVFFVEPLFSARFGPRWLQTVVNLIQSAGQDVQLHLHPEWTDEITPPIIDNVASKRQHLTYYTEAEQTTLIGVGRRLLEAAKQAPVTTFRAGSFAANRDTYRALQANGMLVDSSLNAFYDYTAGTVDGMQTFSSHRRVGEVDVYPVTVFRDGFRRHRAAQVNGCSFGELRAALVSAHRSGVGDFVIVSHNFEMLKPGGCDPDWVVVRRFENLCGFLAANGERFDVRRFDTEPRWIPRSSKAETRPITGVWVGAQRLVQQAGRWIR